MEEAAIRIITVDTRSEEFPRVLDAWPSDSGLSREQITWKLTQSPYGPAWILAALSGETVAAVLVIGRTKSLVGGKVRRSGFIYQTFTAPEWRRRGLMTSLLREARTEARAQGFSLIFAQPNPNSLGIYSQMGFLRTSFMRGWIAPRARDLYRIQAELRRGSSFDSTPQHESPPHKISLPATEPLVTSGCDRSFRTHEFLEWRLGGYPQSQYQLLSVAGLPAVCRDGFRGDLPERQVLSIHAEGIQRSVLAVKRVRRDFAGLVSFSVTDGPWARNLLAARFLPTPKGSPVHVLSLDGATTNRSGPRLFLDGLDVHTW